MNKNSKIDDKLFRQLIREGIDMVAVLSPEGNYKFVSPSFTSVLGYDPDELTGENAFNLVHPDDAGCLIEEFQNYKKRKKEKSSPYRFRKKDGSYIWLQSFGTNLLDNPDVEGIVVHSIDATETHYYSRLDNLERKVLEMNSAGEELETLLSVYLQGIEKIHPGMLCSVLKAEGNQLFNLVSPNLPETYVKAIEGMEIGENQGACGTAAFLGEKVIISDAENDERTAKFLGLVEKYQFKALWSYPVKDENQQVIATFTAYYLENREPGGYEEKTIERAAQLLQLILKNQRTLQSLKQSKERFKYINLATEEVIYDHDLEGDEITLSENFEKIFGYKFSDEEFTLKKWTTYVHPYDREEINRRLDAVLRDRNTNKWNAEFRYAKKDGTYAHVIENSYILRDENGKAVRMIGTVRDMTDRKNREVKQKLISEISRVFNETESVRESLKKALIEFKMLGNFEMAEVWLVSYDKNTIELAAALDKEVKKFYDSDDGVVSFKPGKGLPGITWKSGKFQFWKNLDKHKSFFRRKAAEKAGLKTAYGIPVKNKDEVVGVLVVGEKENVKKPPSYTSILEELAVQLGEEIKRKKLEEELSRVFTSMPDIICTAGFDGYFQKINPAASELLGYSEKELLSQPFINFVHPEDIDKTANELSALKTGTSISFFENRYITKSGRVIWLSWSAKIFHDEKIVYAVAKDVTEEKELEDLHDQATRLARIGSWEVDLIENEIYWSDMTRQILGVGADAEPSMEKGLDFYKEGESRNKMSDVIEQAIEHGTPWDIEVQIVADTGYEKWVRSIGSAELIDGKCVRLYGSLQDIHEKKELEALFDKATRLARIGSWEVDLIKDQIYWSDITREIHETEPDFTANLATGLSFYKPGESQEKISMAVKKAIENGTPWDLELKIITAKGNERWIRAIGEADFAGGKCVRLYGSFQDIHDRKVAGEKLREKTEHIDAIARLNAALLNYEDWFGALDRHLQVIGKAVDADRVYYFENSFDPKTGEGFTTQKLEWCREGIEPQQGNSDMEEIPFSDVPELVDPMIAGQPASRKISDVPKGSVTEHVMLSQQMKVFLAIPIYIQNHFHGFIGFDNCTQEKEWSVEEYKILKTIASNLATAIERQQADYELQTAFEEKNTILESIGDAFFALDSDWTVTYWNRIAEEVLGMPREKIVGKNLWDLYEDATSLEFYSQYHKAVNEQVTVHFEEYYPALEKWFEVSAYPSSSGLSVYFKDVTDRKKAEAQILEKTRQLDAVARFNSLLIKKEHWIDALDECLEMFGMVAGTDRVYYFECHRNGSTGQQVVSMRTEWAREGIKPELDNPDHHNLPLADISPISERLLERKIYNRIVKEIEDLKFREFLQKQKIKSILAIPVFTGDKFSGFIGFDDCTVERNWNDDEISFLQTIAINLASAIENEDAEIAVQKALAEKNEILESIGDGFFALDHEFTVNYWNSKAEELLMTSKEKVLGNYLWEIFDKEQAVESYKQYSKALNEKVAVKFEDYYEPIDKWFDVNVYPSAQGISVFFKDISDRKSSEQRLNELNRSLKQHTKELAASNAELEQFAFVASHDLQEPLRMITGFLAQLEKKYDSVLDEKGRKYIHFATDGAKRMRSIILDLLEFSRIGRMDIEREKVDLNELLQDVLSLNSKLISESKAQVKIQTMPEITAARGPMRQLFQNLVSNAIKYQEKGSKPVINVSSREDDNYWHFEVQDNGIGIDPAYSGKIFNIFQRLHGNDEYSGSGMGLAICKKIVEDHGGEIGVKSELGKGSLFYFSIAKNQVKPENDE